jgi:tetratricopeptide (TPR) repeat protein
MALAAPGFAQQNQTINDPAEYKVYMDTVYNEKDPAKKAAGGEKYLTTYPNSVMRTQTYMDILLSYYQTQNWAKALETADKQAQMAPALSAEQKKTVNLVGMSAAEQTKNVAKLVSYVDKVLADDPKHSGALVTMSNHLATTIPTDAAKVPDHLKKTLEIARRALAAPKIAGLSDAQWNAILVQLHDTATMALYNQKMYAETVTEAQAALKIDKKDGNAYYLMGLAMKPAVKEAIDKYTEAVAKMNLEENRKADQLVRDELKANADGLLSAATTKKDDLAQVFAKSVATGWANAAVARKELMQVFQGTPEELNKLIEDMKIEISK